MKKQLLTYTFALLIPFGGYAKKLDKQTVHYMDSIMNHAVNEQFFPGAQLLVGKNDQVLYAKNFGHQDYEHDVKVSSKDVYDMASCSKVIGTTLAAMKLYDEGLIGLQSKVGDFLPQFSGTPVESLSFLDLMTHVTGLRPFIPFYKDCMNDTRYISHKPIVGYKRVSDSMWVNPSYYKEIDKQIAQSQQKDKIGKYQYSDLNLYLVQLMLEKASGKKLDVLTNEIYDEMDMPLTGYLPLRRSKMKHIIPTEIDSVFRMQPIRGYTHDEFAALLGNVAGHAGLFSNAKDVSHFCRMVLDKGVFNGKRIINEETISLFTSSPYLNKQIYRGIGFDKRNPESGVYSLNTFGHTGFTGTYFWIDADSGLYLVLLTNRVYPTRKNMKMYDDNLRDKLWSRIHGRDYKE